MNNKAYLFAWNPNNWKFEELSEKVKEIQIYGKSNVIWSIASHKKVKIGDRAFIVQLGTEIKGIFASGHIISAPKDLPHWSGKGLVPRVLIELDALVNPKKEEILDIDFIKINTSHFQHWFPQKSGIEINPVIRYEIEMLWFNFLNNLRYFNDRTVIEQMIVEGTSYQLIQTAYERNQSARTLCLNRHGYTCKVCSFDFYKFYGEIGKEFIHVHHLKQLSNIAEARVTNPLIDLVPVCPNCHAMLHKSNPPYTVEELKAMIIPN